MVYHYNVRYDVSCSFKKEYYYASVPTAKSVKFGDISARIEVRDRLKCNPFSWYLKNVYPELRIPHKNAIGWGTVSQKDDTGLQLCIGTVILTYSSTYDFK